MEKAVNYKPLLFEQKHIHHQLLLFPDFLTAYILPRIIYMPITNPV